MFNCEENEVVVLVVGGTHHVGSPSERLQTNTRVRVKRISEGGPEIELPEFSGPDHKKLLKFGYRRPYPKMDKRAFW